MSANCKGFISFDPHVWFYKWSIISTYTTYVYLINSSYYSSWNILFPSPSVLALSVNGTSITSAPKLGIILALPPMICLVIGSTSKYISNLFSLFQYCNHNSTLPFLPCVYSLNIQAGFPFSNLPSQSDLLFIFLETNSSHIFIM